MIDKKALAEQYREAGTFHLLAIVADEDSYTAEAREIAKAIVWERLNLGGRFSLEEAVKAELHAILSDFDRCHQCGREDSSYQRTEVSLRRPIRGGRKVNWGATIGESLLGLALLPIIGVGRVALHTRDEYEVAKLVFQQCQKCAGSSQPIRIRRHPLFELFSAVGFSELA